MRRLVVLGALVLATTAVGAGAWVATGGSFVPGAATGPSPSAEPDATATRTTATVERRTLVVTDEFDGTLGYGDVVDVPGGLTGVVTALLPAGTVVAAGERLYETDGSNRASLMIGDRPAWRTLEDGVDDGADVRQLEATLHGLGYLAEAEVDHHWDDETTDAVVAWQEAKRLVADGVLELGEIVFLPGPIRIAEVVGTLGAGAGPGATIYRATSTEPLVTLDVGAADRADLEVGEAVEVALPDGSTTPGTIAEIGGVATVDQSTGSVTFAVAVALDDPAAAGDLEGAPVTVSVVADQREDVQTVPVNALLALLEGGYAVEVLDGTETRLVRVEPGLFDGGLVEVVADDLPDGAQVVVPS